MTMSDTRRGLLLTLVMAFCLPALLSADDPQSDPRSALEETLLRDAGERLLELVTEGSGELGDHQGVRASEVLYAELDGRPPQEAVVDAYFYVGEGAGDFYLAIYRLDDPDRPRLASLTETHSEYMDDSYVEVVDLDGDGRDEIVVAGGTEGVAPRDLRIYSWDDDRLRDKATKVDHAGVVYLLIDADGDSVPEFLALALSGPNYDTVEARVLRRDEAGDYEKVDSPVEGTLLVRALEEVAAAGVEPRPYSLRLLVQAIREKGWVPKNLDVLQANLETLYTDFQGPSWYRCEIVNAMGWPRNTGAVSLLRHVLSVSGEDQKCHRDAARALIEVDRLGAAAFLLAELEHRLLDEHEIEEELAASLVSSLLSVDDRRGLDLAAGVARDDSLPEKLRVEVIRALGSSGGCPDQAQELFLELVLHSSRPEVRRAAASGLESVTSIRLSVDSLAQALRSPDDNVRAAAALALGKLGKQEAVPHLLQALRHESSPWPRRQILYALGLLDPDFSESDTELFTELLEKESDPEIVRRIEAFLSQAPTAPPHGW